MNIKHFLQRYFDLFGFWVTDNPKKTLLFSLLVAFVLCGSLYQLRIDTSNESNLDKNHPDVIAYKDFHKRYGFEEALVVMVKSDNLFSENFLQQLIKLHQALEQDTYNLDRIKSLANADIMSRDEEGLVIKQILIDFPDTVQKRTQLQEEILHSKLLKEFYISRDGKYSAIYLYQKAFSPTTLNGQKQPFTSIDQHHYVESVRSIISKFEQPNFEIKLSGGPMIGDTLLTAIAIETPLFALASNLIIAMLLLLLFRRWVAVYIPLIIVNVSLASILGVMSWSSVALSSFSQILPAFILTVGVCDAVHFLSYFFQYYDKKENKQKAILQSFNFTSIPILLTTTTTAMGMLSFAFTDIVPISALGIFAALGVFIVLFFTLTLLPAMLMLINIKPLPKDNPITISERLLIKLGLIGFNHPKKTIISFAIIVALSGYAVSQLKFEHDPVKWLPEEHELPTMINLLNEKFYGAIAIEVLVDSGEENGVKTSEMQQKLLEFNQRALEFSAFDVEVHSSRSIANTLEEVHSHLKAPNDINALPLTDSLTAQEILLFEMSGGSDLEQMLTQDGRQARVTLLGPWRDLIQYSDYLIELETWTKSFFKDIATVDFTGVVYLLAPIQKMAIETMASSYLSAVIIITLMMIIILGIKLGLTSLIPNLLPIVVGMGLMFVLSMPLDLYSILIGSIAIGLVVDDTVHFLNSFQVQFNLHQNSQKAIINTLAKTGNALLFTSILLFCGFMTYQFSSLVSLNDFGTITGSIILLALIADIILLPAIIRLIYPKSINSSATDNALTEI